MDFTKSIREQQLRDKLHIIKSAERGDEEIVKSLEDDLLVNVLNHKGVELQKDEIMKGKKASLGEIRFYSGIPYRKVSETGNANKDWVRIKGDEAKLVVKAKEQIDTFQENPPAEQSEYTKLKEDLSRARKRLEYLKGLGYSAHSKETYKKKELSLAWHNIELAELNLERFKYGHKELKKLFKDIDLRASKYIPTAIKGYSTPDVGYEFSALSPETVKFNGIGLGRFNEIKSKIEELGFKVASFKEPSKVIGGSNSASITVKQFNDPDKTVLDKAVDGEVSGKEFNKIVSDSTPVNVNKGEEFQPKDHTSLRIPDKVKYDLDNLRKLSQEVWYYSALKYTDGKSVGNKVSSLQAKLTKAEKDFESSYPEYILDRSGKSNYFVTAKIPTTSEGAVSVDDKETFKAKLQDAINYTAGLSAKLAEYATEVGLSGHPDKVDGFNFKIDGDAVKGIYVRINNFDLTDDGDIVPATYKVDLTADSGAMLPKFIQDKVSAKSFSDPKSAHMYGIMVSKKIDLLLNDL